MWVLNSGNAPLLKGGGHLKQQSGVLSHATITEVLGRGCPKPVGSFQMLLLLAFSLAVLPLIRGLTAVPTTYDGMQQLRNFNTSVTVDLGSTEPLSDVLWGIFFEEIGHAGDGGLYAELVQDRSFDGLARATGFNNQPGQQHQPVDLDALAARHSMASEPSPAGRGRFRSKQEYLRSRQQLNISNDIIVAWQAVGGAQTALTKAYPLNEHNTVAMSITSGTGGSSGIQNIGYWGIRLEAGSMYTVSLYLLNPQADSKDVTVSLVSADGTALYAVASFSNVTGSSWAQYTADLLSSADTTSAHLVVTFTGPGTLVVDQVSLFPTENVRRGRGYMNPWPFRQDLLDALKGLHPRFLRFPGGCYIEGDWLRNGFYWKNAVGPAEARAGHYNGVWSYYSTDGLGLFEYMLLSEELGTEPIWVINNGIAHQETVSGADIMPLVRDALDSLEFISGPADSTWGSLRAAMGHPEPWAIKYMAIGNEGCGLPWDPQVPKPAYLTNYLAFYGAIKAAYPHMRLIASCDMRQDAPTDIYEYHVYTNPGDMWGRRRVFDGLTPQNSHYIFASEYAVTDGGGLGNLIGAVAEAGFMTGLERNSHIVLAAAYAPLFVNTNARPWPTNLIVFDNQRWYGIPSYYVQQMFAQHQGTHYAKTDVSAPPHAEEGGVEGPEESIAASATCQDPSCASLSVKIVNFAAFQQLVAVQLRGPRADCVVSEGTLSYLTSGAPDDENTLDQPLKVSTKQAAVDGLGSEFVIPVSPFSVNVLSISLSSPQCGHDIGAQLQMQARSVV